MEVDQFLSEHGISLHSDTYLQSYQALRFENYSCYRMDLSTGEEAEWSLFTRA
jgi:hypothetical protein